MGFTNLAALSFVMFVGAFVVGLIPLTLSISQRRLKFITTFGVGVLVGVAFIVIIPEGMHTVYGLHSGTHTHAARLQNPQSALMQNATNWRSTSGSRNTLQQFSREHSDEHIHEHDHEDTAEHEHSTESALSNVRCMDVNVNSSSIGAALALGFVFMLLVDRLSGGHSHGFDSEHDHGHGGPSDRDREQERVAVLSTVSTVASSSTTSTSLAIELTPLTQRDPHSHFHGSASRENSVSNVNSHGTTVVSDGTRRFARSATVGILVHSAVDGVALGAISVSENSTLELVVFLAIILHKAPAAFGLASFLLYQGRSHEEIRSHLFIFSMAAPVTALLTFFWLGTFTTVNGEDQTTLGLCLLFSGGTFLFTVAVHILPEVNKPGEQVEWKYVLALIVGILSPLLLANEHTHAHAHGHS